MLEITTEPTEFYDEERNEFVYVKPQLLKLEHSLVSVSKWESKWHKAFLSDNEKTKEEIFDYIRCMTINQVNPFVYSLLTQKNVDDIEDYIGDPMTATVIKDRPDQKRSNDVVTSELIYYWMVSLQIPFECEKWHLNRLLTLIKICNVKNQPADKMSRKEVLNQNRILNQARRKRFHTRG